jgi:hypothetical protein
MSMDATFSTNNAATDHFAVLAEMDGTRIPLAYIFVGLLDDTSSTTGSKKQGGSSDASANSDQKELKTRTSRKSRSTIHISFLSQPDLFWHRQGFLRNCCGASSVALARSNDPT